MDWPAQRFDSTNKCYDNSYLQKWENRPIMPGQELRSQDARLEKEQTNFGGDADLPSKATDTFRKDETRLVDWPHNCNQEVLTQARFTYC